MLGTTPATQIIYLQIRYTFAVIIHSGHGTEQSTPGDPNTLVAIPNLDLCGIGPPFTPSDILTLSLSCKFEQQFHVDHIEPAPAIVYGKYSLGRILVERLKQEFIW